MKNVGKEKGDDDCLPNSIGEPSPKSRSKLKTECDAQLTELRLKNIAKRGWVQIYFEPLSFVSQTVNQATLQPFKSPN